MKNKLFKMVIFPLIFLCFVIIYPNNINATEKNTDFIYYNKSSSLSVDNLNFDSVVFKRKTNAQGIAEMGLTGNIHNSSDNEVKCYTIVRFYNLKYELVATTTKLQIVPANSNIEYNQLVDEQSIDFAEGVNRDIYCYVLDVITIDNTNVSNDFDESEYLNHAINKYSLYDYFINNYDVDIVVNENNTFDITETIDVYFNVQKHGIYRNIPLQNTIKRLDGTSSINNAKVSNVNVNDTYKVNCVDDNCKINIGSINENLLGKKQYIIKYTYDIGNDPVKNYDELYYNIIGTEWDTIIENLTFTITMPKEFDINKLGFSSGEQGSVLNDKINYDIKGNVIKGNYTDFLNPGEAVTVRCELPEGYFVKKIIIKDLKNYIIIIINLIFVGISFLIWYKCGKDSNVLETVEFYSPDGLNSLDVGYLYKGHVEDEDVTSLLIYLANKGYIKVSEDDIYDFRITKLKEYDGTDERERMFLEGLFNPKGYSNLNEVTSKELYNSFYTTIDKIKRNIKKNKKYFYKNTSKKIILNIFFIIAFFIMYIVLFDKLGKEAILASILLSVVELPFTLLYVDWINKTRSVLTFIIGTIIYGSIFMLPFFGFGGFNLIRRY